MQELFRNDLIAAGLTADQAEAILEVAPEFEIEDLERYPDFVWVRGVERRSPVVIHLLPSGDAVVIDG